MLKIEAARARVAGAAVTAIDTRGEFAPFVDALGGDVVRVAPEAGLPFDPFAVVPGRASALGARIACLAAAIELLAGGLTDHQAGALEHALSFAFAARGHSDDGDAEVPVPPRLRDVVAALESQSSRAFGGTGARYGFWIAGSELRPVLRRSHLVSTIYARVRPLRSGWA